MSGMVYHLMLGAVSILATVYCTLGEPCEPYTIKPGYIVCVCNSTYCDTVPSADILPAGQYVVFTTSQAGERFSKQVLKASNTSTTNAVYILNTTETRQHIIGFGGAFTDAAVINIANLPQAAQDQLINAYYSKNGLEYTVGRVPMASCDFSTSAYSYDDVPGDFSLSNFSLAVEDIKLKIPNIQKALRVSPNPVKLFASPWSAPSWMKDTGTMTGGFLNGQPGGQYYKTWANYFVKFLQEYGKYNISFWGLTTQNEPIDGFQKNFSFQAMGFTPEQQRDFIKMDLGPALHSAGYGDINLMILDDQRLIVLLWAKAILSDPEASKYIAGIGVHWYMDKFLPASLLDSTHKGFPDKFLFATEASEGSFPWQLDKVDLGAWDRAVSYATDIIQDLNNWVTGWTDWNLALDLKGGPNWVSNFVDSPIIVNASAQEFYKQPMYYVMGHFSKYVVPGSVWISIQAKNNPSIEITAFKRPDHSIAVVIHNLGDSQVDLDLTDGTSGYIHVKSPAKSVQTVLWWPS